MTIKLDEIPFLTMGFRPFFLGAGIFAMISMLLWSEIYIFQLPITIESITTYEWHAHEMFFGYAFAVIAGFLLTSVRTWTGLATAHGSMLLFLFVLWILARIIFMFGTSYMWLAGIFDVTFALCLSSILAHRIVKSQKWQHLGIIAMVWLITISNILFYLGTFGLLEHGVAWGLYGSLYSILALILIMGRRIIPFFIERATGGSVQLFNAKWMDRSILCLFFGFAVNEVFFANEVLSAYLALALLIINTIRLIGWHHPIIWQQSLLWSIYLAFWMISLGFAFIALPYFAAAYVEEVPKLLAIHAFTVGGIGMITLGIMSRVSLAHTGHNAYQPPKRIAYALTALLLSSVVRIILPLLDLGSYALWIALSQGLWVVAFLIFITAYAPILIRAKKT